MEFTTADYYRILATKKEDKYLKTKKIRDAEAAASRSRITKAVIHIRLLYNHALEATFHPSETMQSLFDLVMKVVGRPDLPFYIYTTPPKKQIKNMSQDFYSAGFVPGAIVYFSYDVPQEVSMLVAKLPVIYKHRDLHFYPCWVYTIPSWVLSIPTLFIESGNLVVVTYYVVGLDPNIVRFFKQFLLFSSYTKCPLVFSA